MTTAISAAQNFDCQSCGACCAYSADWPRFSLETEAELDRIPAQFVASDLGGMRCVNDRCTALAGTLGKSVGCAIYAVRPIVCRTCMPGDEECLMARERLFGSAA
ncbi:YkgJ family cysteine cluster protein [Sinorhizobium alkalisoli]|uniref:Fe-S oxidoreductase n=1 Tax=Sinorhizobium alkalisoli TaxID=1752398 RepID=A0A1E3V9X4_9HYPH|nr:YkgJ family cysteine cluster protein [Sinorhizobium alkalisoli]MCA1491092.1 YkgJ family cysteine cluster protein [Ensifer sp. NBAIM29]MCG5477486.1 YkgJ family cysteine cluster protein [Sinorhizobium alkalisoli]ODR89921.1 Fe-S oxidoreductase [Sinorhizobium alkalisoli]QFI64963.1 Ferredoxin [Sinorhizobium alkalisoli]